jgi:hypothetical protein
MRLLAACAAAALLLAPSHADAWYFPEHVAVAKDALVELPREMRGVLEDAIARARAEHLPICARADVGLEDAPRTKRVKTRLLRAEKGVDCIPYGALAALAGDHSSSTEELRRVVAEGKGIEVTTAAAYEWHRFLRAAEQLPNTPMERMSFVHELDVDFYFIDPGYEIRAGLTRSHFVDAGHSLDEVVREAGLAGAVDNAVGQFLAHHVRALQLAARGHPADALLEHGLSLHFLEDAFAAGHLVMNEQLWRRGNSFARHRHDYFDARGLRVRRAMSAEPCLALEQTFEVDGGLPPCWTTTGDGHLGLSPDASDRAHLARAIKKAELALVMAFDPAHVLRYAEALPERDRIAFGQLFDPTPWWTLAKSARRTTPLTGADALQFVRSAAAAVEKLREGSVVPAVVVGRRSDGALFDEGLIADAVYAHAAFGSVGGSLVRPVLVELPAAEEADVSKLQGQALTDHGMAYQLLASVGAGMLLPTRSPIDFFAPAVGGSAGISYRFGTYLPGRQMRSVLELNFGMSLAVHVDANGRAGGNPTITMLDQELRWPILWELLTSYLSPFDLRASQSAGNFILLGGARTRQVLTDPLIKFWGVDIEAAALELWRGSGSYPLYGGSVEARLYLGVADPSIAQPSAPTPWAPTVGLMLASGYSTFF